MHFAELIIITRGGGSHWIEGNAYPVSAGDIFLIQDNTQHYFQERHDLEMYNIMFDNSYLVQHLASLRSLSGFNAFFIFEPLFRRRHAFMSRLHLAPESMLKMRGLLNSMLSEVRDSRPGSDLMMLSRVLEIFVMIAREYSRSSNSKVQTLFRLGEVISRMENNYRENWTVARLAKIAAMAPSTFLPVFREATGSSPIDYLLNLRLTKAAEILLKDDCAISEVAANCGFRDSNYFSRQFRKFYNCSPRDYRKRF
jgi:AraC-like DNA-binding protein